MSKRYQHALIKSLPEGSAWRFLDNCELLKNQAIEFERLDKAAETVKNDAINLHEQKLKIINLGDFDKLFKKNNLDAKIQALIFAPLFAGARIGVGVYSDYYNYVFRISYKGEIKEKIKEVIRPYMPAHLLVIYKDETGADIDYHRDEFISAVAGGSLGDYAIEQDTSYIKVATNGVPFAWQADELQEYFDAEFPGKENYIYI